MKQRLVYEAPETELLFVRLEGNFLYSDGNDGYGGQKEAGQDFNSRTYNDDF